MRTSARVFVALAVLVAVLAIAYAIRGGEEAQMDSSRSSTALNDKSSDSRDARLHATQDTPHSAPTNKTGVVGSIETSTGVNPTIDRYGVEVSTTYPVQDTGRDTVEGPPAGRSDNARDPAAGAGPVGRVLGPEASNAGVQGPAPEAFDSGQSGPAPEASDPGVPGLAPEDSDPGLPTIPPEESDAGNTGPGPGDFDAGVPTVPPEGD